MAHYAMEALPVTLAHVLAAESLPPHHRDPFDRLLIAQANIEGIPIVTADPEFRRYQDQSRVVTTLVDVTKLSGDPG